MRPLLRGSDPGAVRPPRKGGGSFRSTRVARVRDMMLASDLEQTMLDIDAAVADGLRTQGGQVGWIGFLLGWRACDPGRARLTRHRGRGGILRHASHAIPRPTSEGAGLGLISARRTITSAEIARWGPSEPCRRVGFILYDAGHAFANDAGRHGCRGGGPGTLPAPRRFFGRHSLDACISLSACSNRHPKAIALHD